MIEPQFNLPLFLPIATTTLTYDYDSTCCTFSNTTGATTINPYDPGNSSINTGKTDATYNYDTTAHTFTYAEVQVYYYGYRYYSPELGRWVSRDPIGERGGFHLYQAFYNLPNLLIDDLGLNPLAKIATKCLAKAVTKSMLDKLMTKAEEASIDRIIRFDCISSLDVPTDGKFDMLESSKKWLESSTVLGNFASCSVEQSMDALLGKLYDDLVSSKKIPSWLDPQDEIGKKLKEAAMNGKNALKDAVKTWALGTKETHEFYTKYNISQDRCCLTYEVVLKYNLKIKGLAVETIFFKTESLKKNEICYEDGNDGINLWCQLCPCKKKGEKNESRK